MDPQRECDLKSKTFCQRNDWKAEIIVNPCKTPARMRLLIASEISPPWKKRTLCQCRKNANFECHHCKTAARMQIPIRFTMDPQRECDFFLPAKRLKSRNYSQPLQNPSEDATFDCQRNAWKAEVPFVSAEKMWILSATTAKPKLHSRCGSIVKRMTICILAVVWQWWHSNSNSFCINLLLENLPNPILRGPWRSQPSQPSQPSRPSPSAVQIAKPPWRSQPSQASPASPPPPLPKLQNLPNSWLCCWKTFLIHFCVGPWRSQPSQPSQPSPSALPKLHKKLP